MELRRAADALMRFHTSPLARFLAPSVSSQWQSRISTNVNGLTTLSSQRSIHSSSNLSAGSILQPSITTSAEKPQDEVEGAKEEKTGSMDWLEKLDMNKVGSRRFQSNPKDQSLRSLEKGSSASDLLLEGFNRARRDRTNRFNLDRMASPEPVSRAADLMKSMTDSIMAMPAPQKIPIRLNSTTGRTVPVGGTTDIAQALILLNRSCARNKVSSDFRRQRFHERPGLKRKRLHSQRWRKRFLTSFKATVKRVKDLRRQGW